MMLIRRLGHGLLVVLASCAIVRSAFTSQGSTHQSTDEYGNTKFIVDELEVTCFWGSILRCVCNVILSWMLDASSAEMNSANSVAFTANSITTAEWHRGKKQTSSRYCTQRVDRSFGTTVSHC